MKQEKRILLLTPSFMNIYKDIIACLEKKGWLVSWIKDNQIPKNPYLKDSHFWDRKPLKRYNREVETLWRSLLSSPQYSYKYDAFLAINGLMAHPVLFEILKNRNAEIKTILYLYDNINGHFQVDSFFHYYNKVFSFDISDCRNYNLHFLPIYWSDSEGEEGIQYDIFGLASLRYESQDRINIFERVKKFAKDNNLSEYIKLVYPIDQNKYLYALKYIGLRLLGKRCFSMEELKSNDLFTNNPINPEEFRSIIQKSRIILDTQNPYQDGLTARFMWALGLGKKIITSNMSANKYDFYNKEQVFVLNDNYIELPEFVETPYRMSDAQRNLIVKYRIDNWIDTLLE